MTDGANLRLDRANELRRSENHRKELVVLVLEERPFFRECMVAAFNQSGQVRALAAANAKDYRLREIPKPGVVLICVPEGARLSSASALIAAETDFAVPAVVSSNDRPAAEVLELLKAGIRGFIPTSVAVDVAVQALRLVQAGGTFVPESCLRSLSSTEQPPAERPGLFTHRQLQVVEAIRQGKPNKIIAYELSMCESTVKVHVRTIMKKLKARNRTQVAYLFTATSNTENATAIHP
jgi:DNA-binding NarL/FixJ family response regulator